jgi:acyl carrier protein phosphodiesterase
MINQPGGKIFQINEVLSEDWSYDENKINQFVAEAEKDVQMASNLVNKFGSNIVNISLKDIYDNMEQMKSAQQKLNSSKEYISGKFDKFYDIVETYEVGEYPDNVSKLYDLSNKLDSQKDSLSDLSETFNTLIDATEWLAKYNKDVLDIQTID